jgi:hypothetical protein
MGDGEDWNSGTMECWNVGLRTGATLAPSCHDSTIPSFQLLPGAMP